VEATSAAAWTAEGALRLAESLPEGFSDLRAAIRARFGRGHSGSPPAQAGAVPARPIAPPAVVPCALNPMRSVPSGE
jgi:hypothetical protein